MPARDSQQRGRSRLQNLAVQHETAEWEMLDERKRFAMLARDTSKTIAVAAFNLFQTPEGIAEQMAERLEPTGRILEPSTGLGRLYRAVRKIDAECHFTLVDESPECCGQLYRETEPDRSVKLVQGDFLEQSSATIGTFDRIIMNPPFKMWRDIKHILHARTMLKPSGRLVALCANGPRQNEKLKPIADEWIELPASSFACEGTGVNVAMLVIYH